MQFARAKLFWPQQADCLQQRVLTFYRRVYRSVSIEIVLFGRCVVPAPVFGSYSRIPTHSSVDSILWSLAQSVRPEHRRLWMAFICKSIDSIRRRASRVPSMESGAGIRVDAWIYSQRALRHTLLSSNTFRALFRCHLAPAQTSVSLFNEFHTVQV